MGSSITMQSTGQGNLESLAVEPGARRREPLKREVAAAESCGELLAEAQRTQGAARGERRAERAGCHVKRGDGGLGEGEREGERMDNIVI